MTETDRAREAVTKHNAAAETVASILTANFKNLSVRKAMRLSHQIVVNVARVVGERPAQTGGRS